MDAVSLTWQFWCIAGLVLLGLEIFLPGAFVMWFGLGALITAALTFFLDITSWETQSLIFVPLSVACLFLGRRYIRKATPEPDPLLNKRLAQYVGRTAKVAEPISGGTGKIKLGDTLWLAKGPDAPVGTEVRVVGAQGSDLIVEPVQDAQTHEE